MKQQTANRLYLKEFIGAVAMYGVILIIALKYGSGVPAGPLRTAVMVSPMIGFSLAVWAIARHFRRVDEYIRQTSLENVTIAAALTAGWTFTYGFLENAGYPMLSMFTVWPVMGGVWAVVSILRGVLHR